MPMHFAKMNKCYAITGLKAHKLITLALWQGKFSRLSPTCLDPLPMLGTMLVTFDCDFPPCGTKLPEANSPLWKGMLVTASFLQCYIITSVLLKSHHPSQVHYKVPTDGILKSEDGGIYGQQRDSEKKIIA